MSSRLPTPKRDSAICALLFMVMDYNQSDEAKNDGRFQGLLMNSLRQFGYTYPESLEALKKFMSTPTSELVEVLYSKEGFTEDQISILY